MGRLLMITITKSARLAKGTVFESKDGTRFIVRSVPERQEACVHAMAAGPEAHITAVRRTGVSPTQSDRGGSGILARVAVKNLLARCRCLRSESSFGAGLVSMLAIDEVSESRVRGNTGKGYTCDWRPRQYMAGSIGLTGI